MKTCSTSLLDHRNEIYGSDLPGETTLMTFQKFKLVHFFGPVAAEGSRRPPRALFGQFCYPSSSYEYIIKTRSSPCFDRRNEVSGVDLPGDIRLRKFQDGKCTPRCGGHRMLGPGDAGAGKREGGVAGAAGCGCRGVWERGDVGAWKMLVPEMLRQQIII